MHTLQDLRFNQVFDPLLILTTTFMELLPRYFWCEFD